MRGGGSALRAREPSFQCTNGLHAAAPLSAATNASRRRTRRPVVRLRRLSRASEHRRDVHGRRVRLRPARSASATATRTPSTAASNVRLGSTELRSVRQVVSRTTVRQRRVYGASRTVSHVQSTGWHGCARRVLKRSTLRSLGVLSICDAAGRPLAATALRRRARGRRQLRRSRRCQRGARGGANAPRRREAWQDPARGASVEPKPAEPRLPGAVTMDSDPVADGANHRRGGGGAGLSISSTRRERSGLSRSRRASTGASSSASIAAPSADGRLQGGRLLQHRPVRRDRVRRDRSIASGLRESSVQTGIVDAVMYAETARSRTRSRT